MKCDGCTVLRAEVRKQERAAGDARIALSQLRGQVRLLRAYQEGMGDIPPDVLKRLFEMVPGVGL